MRSLIIMLLLLSRICYSQTNGIDTLKKYSYLLFGKFSSTPIKSEAGTGFFIRYQHRLFLVSNYHVFIPIVDPIHASTPGFPTDVLEIRIPNTYSGKMDYKTIDVRGIQNCPTFDYRQRPDIYFYEITEPWKDSIKVNSLDKIIFSPEQYNSTPITAIGYGFRVYSSVEPNTDTMLHKKYEGHLVETDSLFFVLQPAGNGGNGMSGTPVFFKYAEQRNGKLKEKIKFGGVIFAGNDDVEQTCFIVRYDAVIRAFYEQLYKKQRDFNGVVRCPF